MRYENKEQETEAHWHHPRWANGYRWCWTSSWGVPVELGLLCRLGFMPSGVSQEERSWLSPGSSAGHCPAIVLPFPKAQQGSEVMWVHGWGARHTNLGHLVWRWVRTARKSSKQSQGDPTALPCTGLGWSKPATLCRLGNRRSDASDWYLPLPSNH